MFPNKTMCLQISLPHPILAGENCPPCNVVLKRAMLIRTFLRKYISLPTPLSLYHSCPAFPGLQRTDCSYTYITLTATGNSLHYFISVFSGALFSFPDQFLTSPQPGLCFFSGYCLCSNITDTLLVFTAPVSSPSSMNF